MRSTPKLSFKKQYPEGSDRDFVSVKMRLARESRGLNLFTTARFMRVSYNRAKRIENGHICATNAQILKLSKLTRYPYGFFIEPLVVDLVEPLSPTMAKDYPF